MVCMGPGCQRIQPWLEGGNSQPHPTLGEGIGAASTCWEGATLRLHSGADRSSSSRGPSGLYPMYLFIGCSFVPLTINFNSKCSILLGGVGTPEFVPTLDKSEGSLGTQDLRLMSEVRLVFQDWTLEPVESDLTSGISVRMELYCWTSIWCQEIERTRKLGILIHYP